MISDVKKEQTFDGHWIAFQTDSQTTEQLFTQAMEYLSKGKKISLKIKTERRSLDSNAYCWVMLGKLSEKLKIPPVEIYKELIKDTHAYYVMTIKDTDIETATSTWESNGTGWFCENLGACNTPGYHNFRNFYGSSAYTNAQMSDLINLIVTECELQGIETLPDEKLKQIKNNWRK